MNQPVITLASASPRRAELLAQLCVPHLCMPATIDETAHPGEPPSRYVARMAHEKCKKIIELSDELPVLGSDTIVVCENVILGKPADQADHQAMMRHLSDKKHQVITAIELQDGERRWQASSTSIVTFRALDDVEIAHYWATGEPHDKAGGYAIQGLGAQFVQHLNGSYSGVMGLPLFETANLLRACQVSIGHAGKN